MKRSARVMPLLMALSCAVAPAVLAQTTPPAQTPPVQTAPPPPPPPPVEEQNSHPVAKGVAAGAAFGAAANATGGSTTVVHTGNKHHSGSANRQAPAQPQKAKKSRR